MTDEPDTAELENRIDTLESKIEKMMPSRRDALKMGGAALVGGAAMSGTASAGSNEVGTIGDKDATPPKLVDLHSEDINNADTVTTDTLDAVAVDTDEISTKRDPVGNDVTNSRSLNTTFTNTTGVDLFVLCNIVIVSSGKRNVQLRASSGSLLNNQTIAGENQAGYSAGDQIILSGRVLAGENYTVRSFDGNPSIGVWVERPFR